MYYIQRGSVDICPADTDDVFIAIFHLPENKQRTKLKLNFKKTFCFEIYFIAMEHKIYQMQTSEEEIFQFQRKIPTKSIKSSSIRQISQRENNHRKYLYS